MEKRDKLPAGQILRYCVLPIFFLFLIPGIGWWTFDAAERKMDSIVVEAILKEIRSDKELSAEQRDAYLLEWADAPISEIFASDTEDARAFKASFNKSLSFDYFQFRWYKRLGAGCVILGLLAAVIVGVAAALSFRSREWQYRGLRVGWMVLRVTAIVEVLAQGILVVALSYWPMALWAERFSIKLIVVLGCLVVGAIFTLIVAILKDPSGPSEIEGVVVSREEQPELWQRVDSFAAQVGTATPDHIVLGIDDNFFVTEHEATVGGKKLKGRTLYLSLSVLKVLGVDQADSILGHELAHFSGADTEYSCKTGPLFDRFAAYMEALHKGFVTRPVFEFMQAFWILFRLSLSRFRREREYRADKVGAEVASAEASAWALARITLYSQYLGKVKFELFKTMKKLEAADVSARVDAGFASYVAEGPHGDEVTSAASSHPYDSHPPTGERIRALGFDPAEILKQVQTTELPSETWYSIIRDANGMAEKQWKEYESRFRDEHEASLMWRLKPEGEEETALVVAQYPELRFEGPKGAVLILDHTGIREEKSGVNIRFEWIERWQMDDGIGTKQMRIVYRPDGGTKKGKWNFPPIKYKGPGDALERFAHYWTRYARAATFHANLAAHEAASK